MSSHLSDLFSNSHFSFSQEYKEEIKRLDSLSEYHGQHASYSKAIKYVQQTLEVAQKNKDEKEAIFLLVFI